MKPAFFLICVAVLLRPGLASAYICGNGIVELPELCDSSGPSSSCDADCTPAVCGDATVNASAGESCEPQPYEPWICSDDCRQPECGDANGDLRLSSNDALFALREAVGLGYCGSYRCDADESGSVSASDASAVLRRAVGLPVVLHCPEDTVQIATGSGGLLIDVFASEDRVWVVDEQRIRQMTLDGDVTAEWVAPRKLLSATKEWNLVVVADGEKITTLDADNLDEIVSFTAVEPCRSIVLVTGPRVVCGPDKDVNRVFSTYDATTGDFLASSPGYTYNGVPMKKVPGFDGFLTVSGGSPRDFHFYRVDPQSDAAVFVQDSPYHGDFPISTIYTFDDNEARNLITERGLLLRIDPAVCNGVNAGCLVKNGALGALPLNERFSVLTHENNHVIGLVQKDFYRWKLIASDVPSRDILSQRELYLRVGNPIAAASALGGRAVVLGAYTRLDQYPYESSDYEIWVLPL